MAGHRAPSGKMVFILGSKCNFCFSCSITLVSRYFDVSVNKLASHQFPASKFVIEEGPERWSWQLSPGLDFPPRPGGVLGGGVLGGGAVVGLPRRQGCGQPPPPGRHPALAATPVSPSLPVVQASAYTGVTIRWLS